MSTLPGKMMGMMDGHTQLGWSLNPIKAVKKAAKGAASVGKSAFRTAKKAGSAVAKVGKFAVNLAALPLKETLKLSVKLGNIVCSLPPGVTVAAGAAAGLPPQGAVAAQKQFCGAVKAAKSGNIKDLVNVKNILPVMMKMGTKAATAELQSRMSAAMKSQGIPSTTQAAIKQAAGVEGINQLLDQQLKTLKKIPRAKNIAKTFRKTRVPIQFDFKVTSGYGVSARQRPRPWIGDGPKSRFAVLVKKLQDNHIRPWQQRTLIKMIGLAYAPDSSMMRGGLGAPPSKRPWIGQDKKSDYVFVKNVLRNYALNANQVRTLKILVNRAVLRQGMSDAFAGVPSDELALMAGLSDYSVGDFAHHMGAADGTDLMEAFQLTTGAKVATVAGVGLMTLAAGYGLYTATRT